MSITKDTLKDSLKEAMKAKDSVKLGVIRSIMSELQYEEMNKGITEASSSDITSVVQREIKKRKEEIEFAEKANREEQKLQLVSEIKILEAFLPSQLTEAEIKNFFTQLKSNDSSANRGAAMKALKDAFNGQYDGKVASNIAQEVFG
jgi:uncharacterized protein YqeY